MKWHHLSIEQVADQLTTSIDSGLSSAEIDNRIKQYGYNRIEQAKEKSPWQILLQQFLAPVVYLLIAAAAISFFLGDVAEGIAIIIVIFINAAIGFYMEWQAITSMNAIKKMDVVQAKVIREGTLLEVPSDEVTIGDLIYIEAGDVIPSDARLTETRQLQVNESALTGESLPVEKKNILLPEDTILAEQHNMLFKGTTAVQGNAKAIVVGIGINTELGNISEMVMQAQQSATPLEKKLEALTKKLIWLTVLLAIGYFLIGFFKGNSFLLLLETAIAMAVAAIPEGLPIVATIALARGMLRMSKKNVLVKHLASVETLGSANVILTDKTGTLTENKIKPTTIVTGKQTYELDELKEVVDEDRPVIDKVFLIALLCNNAIIHAEGKEIGDPLEVSLLKWAASHQFSLQNMQKKFPRIDEEPFSSDTKYMGTLHKKNEKFIVCAKGAPEELLQKCTHVFDGNKTTILTDNKRNDWLRHSEVLAQEGVRVLAFAYLETTNHPGNDFLQHLILVALIGFIDPPQQQVLQAIDECKQAGIKVVMLTGDHPSTALHIARKIHLTEDGVVVNGKDITDWSKMGKEEKKEVLASPVFARVTPRQKLDIVTLYQENGYIAAMTGDGVNDAPALKKADIGIAMGLRGTQIAKESADLILKDDSFTSIVSAIKQGRIIFENIRKCIIFLLSCNLSEILVISTAAFLSIASPLTPLQILYLNLVTDVFPALALGMGRGDATVMKRPPRRSEEGMITVQDWKAILIYSVIITLSIAAVFVYCQHYLQFDDHICNNIVFLGLAMAQLLHVFNLSSARVSFFKSEITMNPYIWYGIVVCVLIVTVSYLIPSVRSVLSLQPLSWQIIMLILMEAILPIIIIQMLKRLKMIM